MLFDTHTHIYLPEFDNDRDDVVDRAFENGVTRLMLPNVDLDTIDALQHTLNAYPDMCSAAMGLHPTSVTENYRKDLDHIFEILDTNSYQAVGEIGIDLYWDKSYQKEQIDAFEMQIRYAAQRSLPVIIHCREALDSILPVLHKLSHLDVRGVFHSFSGSPSFREFSNRAISTSASTVSLLSKKALYERLFRQFLSTASCSKPTPPTLHQYLIGEKGMNRHSSGTRQNLSLTNYTWKPSK